MAALITLDTYKQMIKAGEAFNIAESFNARVGDEQVPLAVKFLERGKAQQFEDGLVPFISGFVGNLDEKGRVTAETGVPVSYTGTRSDIVGLGMVKMNLPGTMFPQEGYFYGFLGLETSDHSKRVSTFSVWFHVYNGNPDMFVNREPFRTELQKELDLAENLLKKADSEIKDKLIDWQDRINKLIEKGNTDLDNYNQRLKLAEENLATLLKEIKENGLLTQADLDAALVDLKDEVQEGLDELDKLGEGLVDVPDIDGGIPDYNIDPLQKLSAQIDPNKFNLGFGTDYHYDIGSDYGIFPGFSSEFLVRNWRAGLRKSLNILSLSNQLDAIVFNGDNTDSPIVPDLGVERKLMVKEAEDFASTAFRLSECPVFILKGNHDNNYNFKPENLIPENVLLDADFKRIYRQNGSFGEKRLSGSNYYYRDFPEKKIRLIGLDSSDFPESTNEDGTLIYDKFLHSGFQETQLNWLANEALQAPEGYGVLITMHWPVNHTVYDYADDIMINHSVLKTILEDFAAGCDVKEVTSSCDLPVDIKYQFKGKGNLIAVLSGHRHLDQQVTMNGINYVLTRCSLSTGDNMIREKRMTYEGTPLEDAFDVVSVDTAARTMTLTRFGAGSEDARYATREFSY